MSYPSIFAAELAACNYPLTAIVGHIDGCTSRGYGNTWIEMSYYKGWLVLMTSVIRRSDSWPFLRASQSSLIKRSHPKFMRKEVFNRTCIKLSHYFRLIVVCSLQCIGGLPSSSHGRTQRAGQMFRNDFHNCGQ